MVHETATTQMCVRILVRGGRWGVGPSLGSTKLYKWHA
jgi:hypothetical protein